MGLPGLGEGRVRNECLKIRFQFEKKASSGDDGGDGWANIVSLLNATEWCT